MTNIVVPDETDEPTIELWPRAGQALGFGRSTAYEAARKGTFPIPVFHVGTKARVVTRDLRDFLKLP